MALLHFISHGKRQKLHLYIHIMNKKNLNYVIAKYGITFFFGVHNVNNAMFTYCHVIRNVIMTEKTTIKNKTVLQYDYQTLKSA